MRKSRDAERASAISQLVEDLERQGKSVQTVVLPARPCEDVIKFLRALSAARVAAAGHSIRFGDDFYAEI